MLTGDMLRRSAHRFPAKPAILWGARRMAYAELNEKADRLADALIGLGLQKQSKVAILCRNRPEYGVAFFGAARSGAVLVNVSVLYAPDELAYVLDKADAEALIFEDLFADKVAAVKDGLAKLRHLIAIGEPALGAAPFEALLDEASAEPPALELDERDPFCMTYTGGTTGRPKGVLASHRARDVTAHTVMVEEAIDERDVVGVVTPMFHVAALNIMFQPAILAGATVTMLSKWDVAEFARMAERTGMTAAFMVPTQITMLVNDPDFDPAPFGSWRKLSFAGAPMPDPTQKAMMAKLPQVRLTQIYGQSEMGVICVLRHWYLPEKLGAVGRQSYNVDTRVVDPEGRPARPGEIGEVVSRGDNLMTEYYGEPEQTAAFFKLKDGWGWSGDLATIDEEGFITLIDRSKDMIISGGENIYPKEIEDVLYLHEAVNECAVFGIPDDKWGEVPAAHVALKPGRHASEAELIELCAEHLARFKRPRMIRFVDDFPKTAIGKIQKTVIKQDYWKEREKKI